jgi:hypothetical protein
LRNDQDGWDEQDQEIAHQKARSIRVVQDVRYAGEDADQRPSDHDRDQEQEGPYELAALECLTGFLDKDWVEPIAPGD